MTDLPRPGSAADIRERVTIRRVGLVSLAKYGCLLGAVASVTPSVAFGLLVLGAAHLLQGWLEGWKPLSISLLGQEILNIDFVRSLGMERLLHQLQLLSALSLPALILIMLGLALLSGLLLAAIAILVGVAYNLLASVTGGLVLETTTAARSRVVESIRRLPPD